VSGPADEGRGAPFAAGATPAGAGAAGGPRAAPAADRAAAANLPPDAADAAAPAPGAADPAPERPAPAPAPLVVIDPDAALAARLAAEAEALGRAVQPLAPGALPGALAAAAAAAAVVVAWDCGACAGLDVAEAILGAADAPPVALGAEAPTRPMVELAVRAGARGVVRRPYDAGELRRRLLDGPGRPAPDEDGAP